jgi:S1-C subfamily serine protease
MVIPTSGPQVTPTPYRWKDVWPVVRIKIDNGRGNGVLISSNEVLTAYHVVQGASFINVILPGSNISDEEERLANLVGFNVEDDIALLNINPFSSSSYIDFAKLSPIPYNADGNNITACQKAVDNGDIVVVETTGNSANFISVNRLWGKRSIGLGNGRKFLTDLDLASGTSGSPIYNFAGRYLVGIVLEGTYILSNRLNGIALDGCVIKERLPELRSGANN